MQKTGYIVCVIQMCDAHSGDSTGEERQYYYLSWQSVILILYGILECLGTVHVGQTRLGSGVNLKNGGQYRQDNA